MMSTTKENVKKLRAEVSRLAGEETQATDEGRLRSKLADLTSVTTVSFQITRAARGAMDRVLDGETLNPMLAERPGSMSELIRRALADYARKHGYESEAALISEASS